jgi:hypothetical protein
MSLNLADDVSVWSADVIDIAFNFEWKTRFLLGFDKRRFSTGSDCESKFYTQ